MVPKHLPNLIHQHSVIKVQPHLQHHHQIPVVSHLVLEALDLVLLGSQLHLVHKQHNQHNLLLQVDYSVEAVQLHQQQLLNQQVDSVLAVALHLVLNKAVVPVYLVHQSQVSNWYIGSISLIMVQLRIQQLHLHLHLHLVAFHSVLNLQKHQNQLVV